MAHTLFHLTIVFYTLAVGCYLAILVLKKPGLLKAQVGLTLAGFAVETVDIIWRWLLAGHPPVFGTFENGLAASWFLVLIGLVVAKRQKIDLIYLLTPLTSLAVLYFTETFSHRLYPLTISEASLWVDFHVTFAWLAFASLTVAGFICLTFLWPRLAQLSGAKLPSAPILEDLLIKYSSYAFITFTITITSGSYYSLIVFGRWWKWDPVESLSLLLWLCLGLIIHLKRSFGWRGSQLSWLMLIGVVSAITAYWLLYFFPPGTTYHVFDIEGRTHTLL